jgi:hypothetical protein
MLAFFTPPPPPRGPPQEPDAPAPNYYIDPEDKRRAWTVDITQGFAGTLGVLGFNFQTAHNLTEWIMPVAFQLACLGAGVLLRIPFALLLRTNPSTGVRIAALAGLIAGTGIDAITLYEAAVTAYAPKFTALEETGAGLAEAKAKDAVFQEDYQAKKATQTAAQQRVNDDITRATGASADLGKQTRVCDSKGSHCHTDSQARELGKNLVDTRADKKADRGALATASKELAKLDPSITANLVLVNDAAYRKAGREELFHRMASDLFGHDLDDTGLMWAKRIGIALPCIFAAMAGSLYAFCCARMIPRPKEEKKPDDEETIKIGGAGMAEFGAAVSEYGQSLREAEDLLRDDSATPELPAPAKVEPPADNAKAKRTPKNAGRDGRTRQGKAAKRKANSKNGAANNVLKFPRDKESYPDGDIPF